MDDIAPALLKNIQDTFEGLVKNDEALSRIRKRLESGKASYADAQDYAGRIAKYLQQAYSSHLSADSLPDGPDVLQYRKSRSAAHSEPLWRSGE